MDRFSTRRKLLRGSLSAPLVLTVASPSVLANSSFIACTDRNEGLNTSQPYTGVGDNVYRVEVPVYQLTTVSGDSWPAAARFELINGRYYRIDESDTVGIELGGRIATQDGTRHKIVWFDANGNEIGSGWLNPYTEGGTPGEAVSGSCWASFNGTAPV